MVASFRLSASRAVPEDPFPWVAGLMLAWHAAREKSVITRLQSEAQVVVARSVELYPISDNQITERLEHHQRLALTGRLSKARPALLEALATLREVCRRALGLEPYAAQIMSVLAMHDGYLVQLAPGEGKTMTIGLLAVLFGWSGRPCHIITANDYLAQRDATELDPLYTRCSVSLGMVLNQMSQDEKREQYQSAVVYSTVKQLLADYLTDQINFGGPVSRLALSVQQLQKRNQPQLLMRGLDTAIVDEADNILIDEAITPMIISGPNEDQHLKEATQYACRLCESLVQGQHFLLDRTHQDVRWTQEGEAKILSLADGLPALWRGKARREDLFSKAILARDYFVRDEHYVVLDEEVVIVDAGTGRAMPGRSWSYGLHQAVEARAGVAMTQPRKTLARMSFQNYFKLYRRLVGASGTLQTIGYELFYNYRVPTLRVPSRLPSQMEVLPFQVFVSEAHRNEVAVQLVKTSWEQGRPVLVGAKTIEDSEAFSQQLSGIGVPHQLLNAKKVEAEAQIIGLAGQPGKVTVATNMAGRGTDIRLHSEVRRQGGLQVVVLEPQESARLDWQLYGRCARQGDPGQVFPMLSLQDKLLTTHVPVLLRAALAKAMSRSLPSFIWSFVVRYAQLKAQAQAFSLRQRMNEATREHRRRLSFSRYD